MRYISVLWRHSDPSEPTKILYEIDNEDLDSRKLEIYADERIVAFQNDARKHSISLNEAKIPDISIINNDPQFTAIVISKDDFDVVWKTATEKNI